MSADQFRKKSRRAMASPRTRPVKVGRFVVTKHAQNRMVQRDIPNEAMIRNLCRKALAKSPVKIDSIGRPSYERHNTESTTTINPNNNNVSTIYPINVKVAKRYGITRTHLKTETELRYERRSAGGNTVKKNTVTKKTKTKNNTTKVSANRKTVKKNTSGKCASGNNAKRSSKTVKKR